MTDYSQLTLDILRAYLYDNKAKLSEDTLKTISGWIRSRSIPHLASCVSHFPNALSHRETLRVLMQIEAFVKKNSVFSAPEASEVAIASFFESEKRCRITNRRLDHYLVQRERLAPDLNKWLIRMETYISRTLGPLKPFLDMLPGLVRVTSGATSTRSRRVAFPHSKMSLRGVTSLSCKPLLEHLYRFYGFDAFKVRVHDWNRIETVPKNWKTDRTIACEPEGNIPFQLAFDSYAKAKLRKRGIDLSDQTKNQRLAIEASENGRYATIDLKAASDTVAYNTVAALFPEDWFQFLCAVRSPVGKLPSGGGTVRYAKFSSMGNGTTFCIETLIFAAASYAVGSVFNSVYGDDIVIETEYVADLLRLLRFLGFTINQDKTHIAGPFRESCGVNCFDGVDITPFYIKEWDDRKAILSHNVNGLASICLPGGRLEDLLVSIVKREELPLVPFNSNSTSGVFIDVRDAYTRKLLRAKHSILSFKGLVPKERKKRVAWRRAYYLWHFRVLGRSSPEHRELPVISSWVTTASHKYVRKWVHWIPPVVGTPIHLYWWSERLLRP